MQTTASRKREPTKRKVIAVSSKLQAAWDALLARQAKVSPFLAHDLPGGDAEIERVLKQTTHAEAEAASASFLVEPSGKLAIEVLWSPDPEVIKKHKGNKK